MKTTATEFQFSSCDPETPEPFERRGHIWGGRYCSNLVADGDAVMVALIYVEINAIQAGLVVSAELWVHGSFRLRDVGLGGWLLLPP